MIWYSIVSAKEVDLASSRTLLVETARPKNLKASSSTSVSCQFYSPVGSGIYGEVWGRRAMARPGPPLERPIFTGMKMKYAPRTGSWSRFVRISM